MSKSTRQAEAAQQRLGAANERAKVTGSSWYTVTRGRVDHIGLTQAKAERLLADRKVDSISPEGAFEVVAEFVWDEQDDDDAGWIEPIDDNYTEECGNCGIYHHPDEPCSDPSAPDPDAWHDSRFDR